MKKYWNFEELNHRYNVYKGKLILAHWQLMQWKYYYVVLHSIYFYHFPFD